MSPSDIDPIAAIATAPGRGGIGVVRVSGRAVAALLEPLFGRTLAPRAATLVPFLDAAGEPIDRGIAIWFPGPHSYTGEDVLELQGHGGPVVLRRVLARVLEAGRASEALSRLRLAEPGEFTRRAFLNDKLDLAQAEAVADLIEASTDAAARAAVRSLEGRFSGRVHALVDGLIELRSLVEATIDFPEEEDVDVLAQWDAQGRLDATRAALDALLAGARQGARLREGLTVVLAGAPNVGKSSLLNALAERDVAIVTPIAGTTRDRVEQAIEIDGVPLHLVDTAGLRRTEDAVERIGIERTLEAVARADVVLRLVDADASGGIIGADTVTVADGEEGDHGGEAEAMLVEHLPVGVPVLRVRNKIDRDAIAAGRDDAPRADASAGEIRLSARTGEGLALLRARLLELAGQGAVEPDFIARDRHLEALGAAREHLAAADRQCRAPHPALELFAEELRLAQERLNAITGEFGADDLLGSIFGRFCIGK